MFQSLAIVRKCRKKMNKIKINKVQRVFKGQERRQRECQVVSTCYDQQQVISNNVNVCRNFISQTRNAGIDDWRTTVKNRV